MVNFGLENGTHKGYLGGNDLCAENSFSNYGHMRDSETCSKNYI